MRIGEEANGRTIDLTVGEMLELVLPENRVTGFRWELTAPVTPLVTVERNDFEAPNGPPGRPGNHTWVVRAVEPGKARVELAYRRSWEGDRPAARSFSLVVRIAACSTSP